MEILIKAYTLAEALAWLDRHPSVDAIITQEIGGMFAVRSVEGAA